MHISSKRHYNFPPPVPSTEPDIASVGKLINEITHIFLEKIEFMSHLIFLGINTCHLQQLCCLKLLSHNEKSSTRCKISRRKKCQHILSGGWPSIRPRWESWKLGNTWTFRFVSFPFFSKTLVSVFLFFSKQDWCFVRFPLENQN